MSKTCLENFLTFSHFSDVITADSVHSNWLKLLNISFSSDMRFNSSTVNSGVFLQSSPFLYINNQSSSENAISSGLQTKSGSNNNCCSPEVAKYLMDSIICF